MLEIFELRTLAYYNGGLMNLFEFTTEVYDGNDLIRRFKSHQEAKWFIERSGGNFTIKKTSFGKMSAEEKKQKHYHELLERVGECIF